MMVKLLFHCLISLKIGDYLHYLYTSNAGANDLESTSWFLRYVFHLSWRLKESLELGNCSRLLLNRYWLMATKSLTKGNLPFPYITVLQFLIPTCLFTQFIYSKGSKILYLDVVINKSITLV